MGRKDRNAAKAEQAAKEALAKAEEALAEARKAASAAGEQAKATLASKAEAASKSLDTAREAVREGAENAKASVTEAKDKVAASVGDEPEPEPDEKSGGWFKKLLGFGVLAGAVAFANNLKRRRDQELDESLWDDPTEQV